MAKQNICTTASSGISVNALLQDVPVVPLLRPKLNRLVKSPCSKRLLIFSDSYHGFYGFTLPKNHSVLPAVKPESLTLSILIAIEIPFNCMPAPCVTTRITFPYTAVYNQPVIDLAPETIHLLQHTIILFTKQNLYPVQLQWLFAEYH